MAHGARLLGVNFPRPFRRNSLHWQAVHGAVAPYRAARSCADSQPRGLSATTAAQRQQDRHQRHRSPRPRLRWRIATPPCRALRLLRRVPRSATHANDVPSSHLLLPLACIFWPHRKQQRSCLHRPRALTPDTSHSQWSLRLFFFSSSTSSQFFYTVLRRWPRRHTSGSRTPLTTDLCC